MRLNTLMWNLKMASSTASSPTVKIEPGYGCYQSHAPSTSVDSQCNYGSAHWRESTKSNPGLLQEAIVKAEPVSASSIDEVQMDHQSWQCNSNEKPPVSLKAAPLGSDNYAAASTMKDEEFEIIFKTEPLSGSESDTTTEPETVAQKRPVTVDVINSDIKRESEVHACDCDGSSHHGCSTGLEKHAPVKDCTMTVKTAYLNSEERRKSDEADQCLPESVPQQDVRVNKKKKMLQCTQCPLAFLCVSHLNRHLMSHTQDRPFACTVCQARFKLRSHLKQHTTTHSGIKPFVCQECPATFARSDHLKQHVQRHRGLRPYLCTVCNTAFTQAGHLRKHVIRHKDNRVVYCKIKACKAVFSSVSALQKHKESHEQDRKCRECNVILSRADDMKKHMRVHTKDKPFSCPSCPARFTQAGHLATHKLQHTGNKPFQCVLCGSGFKQSHHLKRHMEVHNGEKPFSCKICSASFRRCSSLTRHEQKCHRNNPITHAT